MEAAAADTNLIRHPTPRRYITTLEALRGRQIVILPTVDIELRKHLPIQAAEHIADLARKKHVEAKEALPAAQEKAAEAALEWWEAERERNDSIYRFIAGRSDKTYGRAAARLPDDAFTDDNDADRWIYAQAMVHGVDVLASRNRHTIITERLEEHFAAQATGAPVAVRSLWEHTIALSQAEGRSSTAVAIEATVAAVIAHGWNNTDEHTLALRYSGTEFAHNLRTLARPEDRPDPEREKLAHVLHRTLTRTSLDTLRTTAQEIYAKRPEIARDTETRYHQRVRAAVRSTDLDLW